MASLNPIGEPLETVHQVRRDRGALDATKGTHHSEIESRQRQLRYKSNRDPGSPEATYQLLEVRNLWRRLVNETEKAISEHCTGLGLRKL